MTKQHATHLIAGALQGSNDNPAFGKVTQVYAGALIGLAGLVIKDVGSFLDEVLADEDDQARGEAMDRMSIFRPR